MLGDQTKWHYCPICKRRVPTKIVGGVRVFKSHMPQRDSYGIPSAFCRGSGQPCP